MTTAIQRIQGVSPEVGARLDEVIRWVNSSTTADEAAEVSEKARQLNDWLRVTKAAEAARIAATRLECLAVRRVALLGGLDKLRQADRTAARAFAELSEEDFQMVLDVASTTGRPANVYKVIKLAEERALREEYTGRTSKRIVRDGRLTESPDPEEAAPAIAGAAKRLLDGLSLNARTFTIAEAGQELARKLASETYDPYWEEEDLQPVLREAVREAIRLAPPVSDDDGAHPDVVTYHDSEIGWVRIPWVIASINQLGAMVALRRKQADEMAAAAAELTDLYMRLVSQSEGDGTRLCQRPTLARETAFRAAS